MYIVPLRKLGFENILPEEKALCNITKRRLVIEIKSESDD